jgi:hypothetical protein
VKRAGEVLHAEEGAEAQELVTAALGIDAAA